VASQLIKYRPMLHQRKMRNYLVKNDGGFLFCEMRTGKTLGGILYLLETRSLPILIVAPCMAMKNWKNWLVAQGFKSDLISLVEGTRKKRLKELSRHNY